MSTLNRSLQCLGNVYLYIGVYDIFGNFGRFCRSNLPLRVFEVTKNIRLNRISPTCSVYTTSIETSLSWVIKREGRNNCIALAAVNTSHGWYD